MRYIIFHEGKAFCTKWFCTENNHVPGMIAVDLIEGTQYRSAEEGWIDIEIDHL